MPLQYLSKVCECTVKRVLIPPVIFSKSLTFLLFRIIFFQIIKTHVVRNIGDGELSEFDPSLGNLSSQMRRMNFDQWFEALQHVLSVLYLMCRRIQSIQEVIIDNIEHFTDVIVGKPNQAEQFMEKLVFLNSVGISRIYYVLAIKIGL